MTAQERLDAVAVELAGYRFAHGSEADLQASIAEILSRRWTVEYEFRLDSGSRIDLYLPTIRVGIEVKTQGGSAAVARQCARYLGSPELDALLLVTRRARLRVPAVEIGEGAGKPFAVVSLAKDAL